MAEVKGLPVRIASVLFTLPLLVLSFLGILFNWPTECVGEACRDPDLAGSGGAVVLFGSALIAVIGGALAVVIRRIKAGVVLIFLSIMLLVVGII